MPTIAEAVEKNERYRVGNPEPKYVKEPFGGLLDAPLVTFQPPANLPVRGSFPPLTVSGADFYLSAQQFRTGGVRSTMGAPPVQPNQVHGKVGNPAKLFGTALTSPTIGGGVPLIRYNRVVGKITPVAVAGGATVTQSFVVAGVNAADKVIGFQWSGAQKTAVVVLAVRVTANNTIAIDFSNPTAGALTPTAGQLILFLVQ